MPQPYNQKIEDVFTNLKASKKGLTTHQAEQRLHKYGFNELETKEGIHPLKIFIQQFASPLIWILLGALAVSIFLGEKVDAIFIGIILIINAILGFKQEYNAEKSIEALQKMASLKAKVIRDQHIIKIESRNVVPGDILILEEGDKVPADARFFEVHSLDTQEAPLTGESLPVKKDTKVLAEKTPLADQINMAFAGTIITKGRGQAIVTNTGMTTQVGKIAKLIHKSTQKETPLQKKLKNLGKYLSIIVLVVAVLVFVIGIIFGKPIVDQFLTAIALAVAAIPEGLPAVITISLALGVKKMIKKNALIRKLPSVETLGSVNVICTDKTGTLTHNEMTVTKIFAHNTVIDITGSGYEPTGEFFVDKKKIKTKSIDLLLKIGLNCNNSKINKKKNKFEIIGDPTEGCLLVSAQKAGVKDNDPRINEIPFSSERKMMTTIHKSGYSYTKGAPEIILDKCNRIYINGQIKRLDKAQKQQILSQNKKFADQALRVLAFSFNNNTKNYEKDMVFVGLQAMIDPPRQEVKDAIKKCHKAGIKVIMITGDQINTAKAIAKELGITGEALTGQDLDKTNVNTAIKKVGIFARVNPEHKLKIVEALKKKGYVVAMTGDGVNDAPALKKADIGISMGITGTDVAKEASDMILTDDNFTSIVNAVEEGRGIFDNIRKFVSYLLSSNLGEIIVILLASILLLPNPVTAIQILWINLITDGLPAVALSKDPHSPGIMEQKPRPHKENIVSKKIRNDIFIMGILIGIVTLILFYLYLGSGIMKAQTIAFTALVSFEIVRLQIIRSNYNLNPFSNKYLIYAVTGSLGLHLMTIYVPFFNNIFKTVPLDLIDWGIIALGGLILMVANWIAMFIKNLRLEKKKKIINQSN